MIDVRLATGEGGGIKLEVNHIISVEGISFESIIYSIVYSKSKQDLILDYWICISRKRRKERMLQKLVDVAHFAVSVLGTSAPPTHV